MEKSVMLDNIRERFNIKPRQLETYSPLTLAYIGDVIYEVIIRVTLCEQAERTTKDFSSQGTNLAKAVTQAKMVDALLGKCVSADTVSKDDETTAAFLTNEEIAIYKRGRNANLTHGSKNASTSQYRKATGFEALIGYLYLKGEEDRVLEIVKKGWELINE